MERQERQFKNEGEILKQEMEREAQLIRSLEKEIDQLKKKKQIFPEKIKTLNESVTRSSEELEKNKKSTKRNFTNIPNFSKKKKKDIMKKKFLKKNLLMS